MKNYIVLTADNIDSEITVHGAFFNKRHAQKKLSDVYKETVADLEGSIEEKNKTANGFSILCYGSDYFYGQVKEITVEEKPAE